MAIYHLTVKIGRRSDGHSARAAATYVLRTEGYESDSDEVVYQTSGHMPDFAVADSLKYWSAADTHERINGRLYRSVMFALPVELDEGRRRDLSVMFAHDLTDEEKLPFTLAIHAGKEHNPHCHLLISERSNDGVDRPEEWWFRRYNRAAPAKGGAKKTESLVPKSWLHDTRETWADTANQALADASMDARIDHRSLKAQGIDREPGKHLGPAQHKMLLKGLDLDIAVDKGVTAAAIGPPAPSPFTPPAPKPAPTKDRAGEARTVPAQDRTAQAVRRQAEAMACRNYHICILHPHTGELDEYNWNLQQIIDNLQRLKQKNAQGHDILIRPYTVPLTGLILVDGLNQDSVDKMRGDGYEPTVTLETAPGQFQVWVRAGVQILKNRRDDIATYLARRYGGDVDAAGANAYGQLAGFTSGVPESGRRPFTKCYKTDTSGNPATNAKELLELTLPKKGQEDRPTPGGGDQG